MGPFPGSQEYSADIHSTRFLQYDPRWSRERKRSSTTVSQDIVNVSPFWDNSEIIKLQTGHRRNVLPQTSEGYEKLASAKGFPVQTVEHPLTECRSHYIGSPEAKTVLLYFHGGGYVLPASDAHLEYLYRLVKDMNTAAEDEKSFCVLLLAYSLVPESSYPYALAQATDALNSLLEQDDRDAASIIVGGDSAGGNLALSLLSHLLHPHPSSTVPRVTALKSPLNGALIISPWVEFDTEKRRSFHDKLYSDVSSPSALASWAPGILRDSRSDEYIEPVKAGPKWWIGLERAVDNVLIWGGGGEVLIDGIKVLMQDMKIASASNVQTIIGQNMCHEEMVVNVMLGYGKGESDSVVENWLQARILSQ